MCYIICIKAPSQQHQRVREILQQYGFYQETGNLGYFITAKGDNVEILPGENIVGPLKIKISKRKETLGKEPEKRDLTLDKQDPKTQTLEEFLNEKFGKLEKAVKIHS